MKYLSISEASKLWGVTPRRIQQLCKSGELPGAVKQGRAWRIPDSAAIGSRNRETARKGLLPLPIGVASYVEAVENYYYVDKTLLIRDFIDALPKVSLFTRPRRFGKTLNMDMLRVFFEKTDADTSIYFQDKAIWRCGEYYRAFQGRYPVIYLSFKDVKFSSWPDARKDMENCLRAEFARHAELENSERCHAVERDYYKRMLDGSIGEVDLPRALAVLSAMLHKHHQTETVIIIDEYDTPIQQGYANGYYKDVVGFIRNLFSGAFKDNASLAYGFLTGILRVAKESVFSRMNNLKVNSIMDDRYSAYFGFTKAEVAELLSYYGKSEKLDEVCEWYDGYRFGHQDIFNPWSVVNYVDDNCYPKAFWQATGSNEIIGEILSAASPEVTENLRRLMQGERLATYIDTDVIYPDLKRNPSSIYSFLLVAGYLKNAEIVPQNDGNFMCRVSIPNKEISFVYAKEVISRIGGSAAESTAAAIQQAIFEKDVRKLQRHIENYLIQTVSVYDKASEAFYQGLMIGLCAILNNRYSVKSNRESGDGRFDIQLKPLDDELPGFVFELKWTKDTGEDLGQLAQSALEQIRDRRYTAEMCAEGVAEIISVGLAFCGKNVATTSDRV